jgi:hypothetical protein
VGSFRCRLAVQNLARREKAMHAAVVSSTVSDRDAAVNELTERFVPMVSGMPGFVAGYWVALPDGKGASVVVFDSESELQALADRLASASRSAVTIDEVRVGEVVAHA